jgi:hypothetical protein
MDLGKGLSRLPGQLARAVLRGGWPSNGPSLPDRPLIPEAAEDRMVDVAAFGFIAGFAVMMTLDVTLG